MVSQEVEIYKKQHLDIYKSALIEIIRNNTDSLIDNDIASLIKKPPLDSMDLLKTKLLMLAKNYKVILNNYEIDKLLTNFRKKFFLKIVELKKIRNTDLEKKINDFEPVRDTEIIKITKKDIDSVNKKLKAKLKEDYSLVAEQILLSKISSVFAKDIEEKDKIKIIDSFKKYVKTTYYKQLNESFSIKALVKDRILINNVVEQGERFLFTKANSHIFD